MIEIEGLLSPMRRRSRVDTKKGNGQAEECEWTSEVEECAMAVTLINVFSVPKGKEDEFVNWWQDVKANYHEATRVHQGKVS